MSVKASPLSLGILAIFALEVGPRLGSYGLGAWIGLSGSLVFGLLFAGLAILWWRQTETTKPSLHSDCPHWIWLLPALGLVTLVLTQPQMVAALNSPSTVLRGLLVLAGLGLILLGSLARGDGWPVLGGAVAVGLSLRIFIFNRSQLDLGGDMIPLVHRATGAFLSGHSPYATYRFPWPLPLTYWPATWLTYVPGRALGLSPRITNLVLELGLIALVALLASRRRSILLLLSTLYLTGGAIEWARISVAPAGWFAAVLALAATVRWPRFAPWAWAFALCATPFAWIPGSLWAAGVLRRKDAAPRALLVAVGGALALALPFFIWAPVAFLEGTLLWFGDLNRFARPRWQQFQTWQNYPGLAGLFWRLGFESSLVFVQLGIWAALLLAFARRHATGLLSAAACAHLAFILTNPILWPYFYAPAQWMLLLALAGDTSGSIQAARRATTVGS